ncbi:putative hexokinase [Helianthus anomalus]
MVINMEWGNFWSHICLERHTTSILMLRAITLMIKDHAVGFREISGLYLGYIVRRVICKMSLVSDIFGPFSSKLSTQFVLSTPLMATMHEDDTPGLS